MNESELVRMEKPSLPSAWNALLDSFREDLPAILSGKDPHLYPMSMSRGGEDDSILNTIATLICIFYRIDKSIIRSSTIRKNLPAVMAARRIFVYIAAEHTIRSLSNIGQYIARDHSSVISMVRTTEKKIFTGDRKTIAAIQYVTSRIIKQG
jgi:hypothetical protein